MKYEKPEQHWFDAVIVTLAVFALVTTIALVLS